MYNQVCDTCTFILTLPPIVSIWDSRMHYKCWYIGSVLQKAWWWLNRVESCYRVCNCIIKLLCLTGVCILYDISLLKYEICCRVEGVRRRRVVIDAGENAYYISGNNTPQMKSQCVGVYKRFHICNDQVRGYDI